VTFQSHDIEGLIKPFQFVLGGLYSPGDNLLEVYNYRVEDLKLFPFLGFWIRFAKCSGPFFENREIILVLEPRP